MKNIFQGCIVIFALFYFTFSFVLGQTNQGNGKTVITSIQLNNNMIDPDILRSSNISIDDNIVIGFDAELEVETSLPISFKVFLNGTFINPTNLNDKVIELKKLAINRNILKIQGTLPDGKTLSPIILEFFVKGDNGTNSAVDDKETEAGFDSTYLLYGIIGLLIVGMIIILMKKTPAKVTQKSANNQSETNVTQPPQNSDFQKAYDKLRKQYKVLEDENSYQRSQIRELKEKIVDLENANLQLVEKKDKLLESKQQLEDIQTQKDDLFAIAVHDIKNPAAAIKSYIELIQSYDLNATEQSEIMESMIRSSEQIVELAHEMTSVIAQSRPEPMLSLKYSSLKKIIDSVCNQNGGYAIKKEVTLLNKSSIDLPYTAIDPAKMEEVMHNLVNNAIKYSPLHSTVTVNTFFTTNKITVEVIDTGVGLSEEDINKAFKKGGKLTPLPTAGEKSTGLGLWIVKKIIEEHGGRVWVKSKLGSGSTFAFEIPIVKPTN